MANSLIVFFAALAFLAFGYASLLRIAYREYFPDAQGIEGGALLHGQNVINTVGQGSIFISIAATSLLLFWGWGMALLWLIAFHLLGETIFNLQQSRVLSSSPDKTKPAHASAFNQSILNSIWKLYLFLIISIAVALMVNLINRQSGLIFALIALFPAHLVLRKNDSNKVRLLSVGLSLIVLTIGLLFSHQLGISIYGEFKPLEGLVEQSFASQYLVWLNFDNTSIITIALIISALGLSQRTHFRTDISTLSGVFIVVLSLFLFFKLVWLRPLIDAPINSLQVRADGLPAFISLGLFLFAGLSLQLLREDKCTHKKIAYKNITDSLSNVDEAPSYFASMQLTSLIQTILSLIVVIILACALGIGAWNTHYIDWNNAGNLVNHFNLSLNSLLQLISANAAAGTIIYSLFISGLAFCGFALALNLLTHLGETQAEQHPSVVDRLSHSNTVRAGIIYITSSLLISNGISINLWLVIGMLAWLMVSNKMVINSLSFSHHNTQHDSHNKSQLIQNGLSLFFILLGSIQVIWTTVNWVISEQWGYASVGCIILCLAILLWKNQIMPLIGVFKQKNTDKLFNE